MCLIIQFIYFSNSRKNPCIYQELFFILPSPLALESLTYCYCPELFISIILHIIEHEVVFFSPKCNILGSFR